MKALALAGVMGGYDSMITAETKNILVEAAWFSPFGIRASSRRHMIHTDASHRFERGADFAAAPLANTLVTKHILEACGGTVEGDLVDIIVDRHRAEDGRAVLRSGFRSQRCAGIWGQPLPRRASHVSWCSVISLRWAADSRAWERMVLR